MTNAQKPTINNTCDSLSTITTLLSEEFIKDNPKVDFTQIEQIHYLADSLSCNCLLKTKNLLGYQYYNLSDLINARIVLQEAEKLFIEKNLINADYVINQNYLGLIDIVEGNPKKASFFFKRCEKIAKSIKDTSLITQSYLQLGLAHLEMKEFLKAEQYYIKCLQSNEYIQNSEYEGYAYQNLTRLKLYTNDLEQALQYAEETESIWKATNFKKGLYYLNQIYAEIYEKQGDKNAAIIALKKCVALHKEANININIGRIYLELGSLLYDQNRLEESTIAFSNSLENLSRSDFKQQNFLIDKLVNIYSLNNDFDGLSNTLKAVIKLVQKTNNISKIQAEQLINSESNLDNKNLENSQLRENYLTEESKSKKLSLLSIALCFILLLTSYLIYFKSQESKKRRLLIEKINNQKIELEEANIELSASTDIIAKQVKELGIRNEDLKNFAYTASHDLKSPLRTIVSFANILKRRLKSDDPEILELVEFIETGGNGMGEIIDNLLAYAKAGTRKPKLEKINIPSLISQVLMNLRASTKEKNVIIDSNIEIEYAIIDKVNVKQVLMNLISNSIKYSNKTSRPLIQISVKEDTASYIFSVTDNGIGIPKDYQSKIFEMFERVPTDTKVDGTGIGLATCKRIIDLSNGRIYIESELGKGSTFTFTLPKEINISEAFSNSLKAAQ